jgi:hypothetical protein
MLRATRVYVPAAAAGWDAGHPGLDEVRFQSTVLEKTCPGLRVFTAGWPPGAQSSDDQTRVLPVLTTRPIAARPMSRLHATLPVFVTDTVSFGFTPAA